MLRWTAVQCTGSTAPPTRTAAACKQRIHHIGDVTHPHVTSHAPLPLEVVCSADVAVEQVEDDVAVVDGDRQQRVQTQPEKYVSDVTHLSCDNQ